MTEFKAGDIVRLTKGEPDKPGYEVQVREVSDDSTASGLIGLGVLARYEDVGWTVELIERPAPPLPTRPNAIGWATVGGVRSLARLAAGRWELYDTNGSLGAIPHPSAIEHFEEAVLIPKDLADKATEWVDDEGGEWHAGGLVEQIADHLKGQDDD